MDHSRHQNTHAGMISSLLADRAANTPGRCGFGLGWFRSRFRAAATAGMHCDNSLSFSGQHATATGCTCPFTGVQEDKRAFEIKQTVSIGPFAYLPLARSSRDVCVPPLSLKELCMALLFLATPQKWIETLLWVLPSRDSLARPETILVSRCRFCSVKDRCRYKVRT
ncbi:hypothetical protein CC80DRAFT_196524 [Byssothecium circinans]|uniref:Uncharacterized protein n=1 Tax=Byssothecium circinans TaxID=147558 RepID=A0A6A5UAD7_9PLEO|nr:hypothetical protein CC80DRAFT_196524 [Byssothecium circinans]